ncbi:MAG TPA: gamma-glutamyl-gamma-aminobutyrate hydrolase family protein [Methylomirabilota bacterium]|jgi:gamma-glutamyl-gamma-aminobutyrate hydrolase PuuD|nr:gamma-glutamyl-gamma-aminobutyrate hydrolase family protein [Methylomirabilota bacterium]
MDPPRIVVTLADAASSSDPTVAELKNRRYVEALERAGAFPVPLDERASATERATALAAMDGLLLSGGADIDPARYGEAPAGAREAEPGRDALEDEAFRAAMDSSVPILGVCRGLQAINVFAGGSLVQHLDGHESTAYPSPAVTRHRLGLADGSRLAEILGDASDLEVNSYHHQAITADRLAPGLRISAFADHDQAGELVEGVESTDPDRWLIGVQCHPERTESSPPVFERLWADFVAACSERAQRAGLEGTS